MSGTAFPGTRFPLESLNAAPLPVTILTGSGAKHVQLTLGGTYRMQPQGAAAYIGFGASASEADDNSATTAGELIDAYDTVEFVVTSANVQWLSRTPASGTTDLRVWQVESR